jgi:hypothetical protein
MSLEVFNWRFQSTARAGTQSAAGLQQRRQRMHDLLFFSMPKLMQEGFCPSASLIGAFTMNQVSDGPQMLAGVMKI